MAAGLDSEAVEQMGGGSYGGGRGGDGGMGEEKRKKGVCVPEGRAKGGQGHASLMPACVHFDANTIQIWVGGRGSKPDKKQTFVCLLPRAGPRFVSV